MKIDEAISIMNVIVHMLEPQYDTDRIEEAVEMAIKALEQEPCDDCISRQAVLDLPKIKTHNVWGNVIYESVDVENVRQLPSVTPQPKMGRWIMPQMDDGMSDPVVYQVRCSICKWDVDPQTWYEELAHGFCPNCGAKMTKIQTGQIVANGELYPGEFDDPLAEEGSEEE